jgi:hypothetical protein
MSTGVRQALPEREVSSSGGWWTGECWLHLKGTTASGTSQLLESRDVFSVLSGLIWVGTGVFRVCDWNIRLFLVSPWLNYIIWQKYQQPSCLQFISPKSLYQIFKLWVVIKSFATVSDGIFIEYQWCLDIIKRVKMIKPY